MAMFSTAQQVRSKYNALGSLKSHILAEKGEMTLPDTYVFRLRLKSASWFKWCSRVTDWDIYPIILPFDGG